VKRLVAVAGMATLMVGVAACGNSTAGNVIPTTTTTASSTTSQPTTTSSSTSLASTDPCSLLPASAATSLGYPAQGKPSSDGGQPNCGWAGTPGVANVLILPSLGISQVVVNGGTLTDITVGSHQAKQLDQGNGICRIALGVTPTSRVDVGIVTSGDPACPAVLAVAKAVEPNLPSS
jgi:hypothetical protein